MCYILTNEQRRCFGLTPIEADWEQVQLKKSAYDDYDSYAYIQGQTVKKLIQTGQKHYCEYSLSETLSEDRSYLQPKTAKGKPVKLSAASLEKRTKIGMAITYTRETVLLYNATTDQGYFRSYAVDLNPSDIGAFSHWVNGWCADTKEADICDIQEFANRKKVRKKYAEGDFFRIRIDRRLWAYGRILLDYGKMRKQEGAFWDIFMGASVVVGMYHVLTEQPISDIALLADKLMLPSEVLMDNIFYYGEAEILGNRPLQPHEENYPIHYGRSIRVKDDAVMLQYGKLFCRLEEAKVLYNRDYHMNSIGVFFGASIPLLRACIQAESNMPYWDRLYSWKAEQDLRNPKFWFQREQVFAQFGLCVEDHFREDPTIPTAARKLYMNEDCAKLLSREEKRTNGAKLSTRYYVYECPCGKGKILEQIAVGFGRAQDWVRIECRACKKKYSLRTDHGHRWELE